MTGEQRERIVMRLQHRTVRTCQSLHMCVLCGTSIRLGERYYDGGYNHRAHETCIVNKCPRCGSTIRRSGDEEAGIQTAWCSSKCGWEVVV